MKQVGHTELFNLTNTVTTTQPVLPVSPGVGVSVPMLRAVVVEHAT